MSITNPLRARVLPRFPANLIAGQGIEITKTAGNSYIITSSAGLGFLDGDKGDITVSNNSTLWTVDPGAITAAKLQNISFGDFFSRAVAGVGPASVVSSAQATQLLQPFSSSQQGVVPPSGGGTSNFLRADGTWTTPLGAADFVNVTGDTMTGELAFAWSGSGVFSQGIRFDGNQPKQISIGAYGSSFIINEAGISSKFIFDVDTIRFGINTGPVEALHINVASPNVRIESSGANQDEQVQFFNQTTMVGRLFYTGAFASAGTRSLGMWIENSALIDRMQFVTGNVSQPITFWPNSALMATIDTAGMTVGGTLSVGGGRIAFPAVQNPSADPNTLDDYEEGTWTPTLTCVTPGDLAVTYSIQAGYYTKVGRKVTVTFRINTATFTHSTAANLVQITGLPFASANLANAMWMGGMIFSGFTRAGFTNMVPVVLTANAFFTLGISGSGQVATNAFITDFPSGGAVQLIGTITYFTS